MGWAGNERRVPPRPAQKTALRGDTAPAYDALRKPLLWDGPAEFEPQRFHLGDAGFDLVCAENVAIPPSGFRDVSCGIRVELPSGVWALLTGRSSTLRKRELMVAQGIIDQGYRGPLFCGVWNLGYGKTEVKVGDRLAQLIPMPLVAERLVLTRVREGGGGRAQFSESDRGESGFGSTGD